MRLHLSFLVEEFGKTQLNVLRSVVSDLYNVDTISEAKSSLWRISADCFLAKGLPHIPKRRDGPSRLTCDVDDVISVLTFVDEQELLSYLPMYVSNSSDNMPSLRLFDGDSHLLR
jgi:hypothetical protein